MKCIQYNEDSRIVRIMDETAERVIREGRAKFISKKVWKEQVRDSGKVKK